MVRSRFHLRLVGAAAALGSAVALCLTATSSSAAASDHVLTLSNSGKFNSIINLLDSVLYTPSFGSIIDATNQTTDLNRVMPACSVPKATATILDSYCFNSGDSTTTEWIPQGVTGVSDATEDEAWGSNPQKPILVSWYSDGSTDKGVRVSIIDPATHRYRHALLVVPWVNTSNNASYKAVTGVHAGGIAWYGNYLYVADTRNGVRAFDLSRIFDLAPSGANTQDPSLSTNTSDDSQIGRHDGVFYGYGYRYLIPQVATWTQATIAADTQTCGTSSTYDGLRFSYVSVDRGGTDSLVAGEYCNKDSTRNGRMASYGLAGMRAATIDHVDGYKASPVTEWALPSIQTQGVAHIGAHWYFTVTHGCAASELLTRTRTDTWTGTSSRLVGVGAEDLYAYRGQSKIYSVTEDTPGGGCNQGRALYSTNLVP